MKYSISSLVAIVAMLSSSGALPSPEEPRDLKPFDKTVMQQRQAVGDFAVLDAFKAQGRANATEIFDEDGESMLYYNFNTAEWDEMYDQLVVEAFGSSAASPLFERAIEHRQLDEGDFFWICTDNDDRPW